MKSKMWKAMIVLLASTVLISCATIMGKSAPETLNIRSTPDQASVVIADESGTKIFGSVVNRRPGIMLSNPLPVYHFMHQTRCSNKRGEPG